MSRISDSLREQARHLCDDGRHMSLDSDQVECIADRIDAEMAELPRGKDGRPIHAEDTLYDSDGTQWTVTHIYYYSPDDGPDVVAQHGNAEINFEPPDYHGMTHERPDSWERIAQELEAWCDRVDVDRDACGEPRELARRIRRLAGREDER